MPLDDDAIAAPEDDCPSLDGDRLAQFDDVMIDIETMSLHAHKALILSVGLLEFDPSQISGMVTGSRMCVIPDVLEQLALQRRVDPGTQKFWAEQSELARAHWREYSGKRVSANDVINFIRKFCAGKKRVWANGTQFDLSNLIGLAEDIGDHEPLWHYQAPRDMRTFCKETPATRLVPIDALDGGPQLNASVAHEPLYDCKVQAWQVWAHYQDRV